MWNAIWKQNTIIFLFQTWNRVIVRDIDVLQKKVQVLYIDYGNEEIIPLNRIHQLNRNIDLFPPCVSLSYFLNSLQCPQGASAFHACFCSAEGSRLLEYLLLGI